MKQCPCKSGKDYNKCCQQFHLGKLPQSALELMRSRFSAYSMKNVRYIIETTDAKDPNFKDLKNWEKEIFFFSEHTEFSDLEIIEFQEINENATVHFKAHLIQNKKKVILEEISLFKKKDDRWFYLKPLNVSIQ